MADKINIEILEDGTISINTDKISQANHVSADKLLAEIQKLAGGKTDIKKKAGHARLHEHNGIFHKH